jgi:hypothetical protein
MEEMKAVLEKDLFKLQSKYEKMLARERNENETLQKLIGEKSTYVDAIVKRAEE